MGDLLRVAKRERQDIQLHKADGLTLIKTSAFIIGDATRGGAAKAVERVEQQAAAIRVEMKQHREEIIDQIRELRQVMTLFKICVISLVALHALCVQLLQVMAHKTHAHFNQSMLSMYTTPLTWPRLLRQTASGMKPLFCISNSTALNCADLA